jgi:3'(2'), 5'-bisphosphate nucleotidase
VNAAAPFCLQRLLAEVEAIARAAGDEVLAVYRGEFQVQAKSDLSPVTAADERAEALVTSALQALAPDWAVVAEEAVSRGVVPQRGPCWWLVDPLDGTREFVARNGEFTVNIALVVAGQPVLGVVYVPVQDRLFSGAAGQGAWVVEQGMRRAIRCRPVPPEGLTVACSRSHGDPQALTRWLGPRRVAALLTVGSSLKFGLIAAGEADLYPRLGRTMEWDIAAGHAVLRAAGGELTRLDGGPMGYGKPGFENPHFVARGC